MKETFDWLHPFLSRLYGSELSGHPGSLHPFFLSRLYGGEQGAIMDRKSLLFLSRLYGGERS